MRITFFFYFLILFVLRAFLVFKTELSNAENWKERKIDLKKTKEEKEFRLRNEFFNTDRLHRYILHNTRFPGGGGGI